MSSLDIPERQILVYYEDDDIPYHVRVLIAQVSGSRWIWCSPDLDCECVDLADFYITPLVRNQSFARDLARAGIYAVDNPLPEQDAAKMREEGRDASAASAILRFADGC